MSELTVSPLPVGAQSEGDWVDIDLYRFFAWVLAAPSRETFAWFERPEARAALKDLWSALGCEGGIPEFHWFDTFADYEAAYIALFDVGTPEPPVPLFESAHDKSKPPQELVLENTYFYDVLGLRTDASRSVPDYLLTQLEFLAALRYAGEHAASSQDAAGLKRAEHEFLERHLLNWVPTARRKLAKLDAPAFPCLLTLLEAFLKARLEESASPMARSAPLAVP